MILPDSFEKQVWDHIVMLILILSALFIPIVVCFFDEISLFQEILTLLIDFFFFVDLIINFHTVYEDKGRLIDDRRKIAKRYVCMKLGFWLDFVTMFPYQELYIFIKDDHDHFGNQPENIRLAIFYGFQIKYLRILSIPQRLKDIKTYKLFDPHKIKKLENKFPSLF